MIVVADTSPMLHLSRIGRLELIPSVLGRVIIPKTVWAELTHPGTDQTVLATLEAASWLDRVEDPPPQDLGLDPGETAAILLAERLKANVLLIDERKGRQVAITRGLAVLGTLGVVAGARRRGLIPVAAPLIAQLRADGFRLSDALVQDLLHQLGEAG